MADLLLADIEREARKLWGDGPTLTARRQDDGGLLLETKIGSDVYSVECGSNELQRPLAALSNLVLAPMVCVLKSHSQGVKYGRATA
jgi:hypothetical protein